MAIVTVYQFKIYNPSTDETLQSRRWGTREAIAEASGEIVPGLGVQIDDADLEIPGFTAKDFRPGDPKPRHLGFPTQIYP